MSYRVENRLRQRNVREGIESPRRIHNKRKVLNSFESLITWTPIFIDKYFDKDNVNACAHAVFKIQNSKLAHDKRSIFTVLLTSFTVYDHTTSNALVLV